MQSHSSYSHTQLLNDIQHLHPNQVRDALHALDLSCVCVRSMEGTIFFWSQGNEQLYGWSCQEVTGRTTHELLKTQFPKRLSEINAELMEHGSWKGELLHCTKSGSEVWVASYWVLQRAPHGSPISVIEINSDITESKRSEERSRYLASIIESSDDAIISKDLDGIITSWNTGAERLFGYSAHEIIGRQVLTLFPPELVDEEFIIMARIHRGERIQNYETVRVAKSGRRVDVSITVSPIVNAFGNVIGASKIVRDISQRKALESAFQESERRQALAVEAGEIGLWSYDVASGRPRFSPRCKMIWGLPPDAPTPDYEENLKAIHPNDVERVDRAFQSSIVQGAPFDIDYRLIGQSGSIRWVQSKGRPWKDAQGIVTQIYGTAIDLTQRKQTEESLRRTNSQLEQFAYATAHDLQEPLRNVALSIELAKQQIDRQISQEAEELLNCAVQNARHVQGMVRELLAYSRALQNAAHSPVTNAEEAFALALENLAIAMKEAAAYITKDQLPMVKMDQNHLLQVFQNLLGNALKYRSAEPPRIHVSATVKQNHCLLSVKDNGIGIEPQFQERVFGMFKRLRNNETAGTGVGLALCKRIIEHYGGEIWVQSDGKTGSTFFFTVPLDERSNRAASYK